MLLNYLFMFLGYPAPKGNCQISGRKGKCSFQHFLMRKNLLRSGRTDRNGVACLRYKSLGRELRSGGGATFPCCRMNIFQMHKYSTFYFCAVEWSGLLLFLVTLCSWHPSNCIPANKSGGGHCLGKGINSSQQIVVFKSSVPERTHKNGNPMNQRSDSYMFV